MTIEFYQFFGNPDFLAETISDDEEIGQIATFCYPGAVQNGYVPGLTIRVSKVEKADWIGHFLQGKESPNGAQLCCAHPDGKHIVVISRGTPYIVNAADPTHWQEIPIRPVMGYCVGEAEGVLVLYDFTKVMGLCANGDVWTSESLSWDGLKSVQVVNGAVEGQAWDAPTGSFVPFHVDIRTGESSGGASPPH